MQRSSSSDNHKNSFHLKKQPTNNKLIKKSKNRLYAGNNWVSQGVMMIFSSMFKWD
jgi:hypothetical protein